MRHRDLALEADDELDAVWRMKLRADPRCGADAESVADHRDHPRFVQARAGDLGQVAPMSLFPDDVRRNPYTSYRQLRQMAPVFHDAGAGFWMLLEYAAVKRALTEHATFSSAVAAGGVARRWLLFLDPPRHSKLRALVARAFAPRGISPLEPRIRQLSKQLLEPLRSREVF